MALSIDVASELLRLYERGSSIHQIAKTLRISRNTARRYIRHGPPHRPSRPAWHSRALELLTIEPNASAVARRLRQEKIYVTSRSVQRLVREILPRD